MIPKINHLFKCNLEENKRKYNLIDLAKCSYNSMMKFMKIHIILNYTIDNNSVSSNYIELVYDVVIEESLLKIKLSLLVDMKRRKHELMIINNRRKEFTSK